MEFEIGIGVGTRDYDSLRVKAAIADEGQLSFLSIGDNPGNLKETYVSLTVLASASTRIRVGTSVTNPSFRDPLVVASALSSIESIAPGRVFLGISSGRARKGSSVEDLRDHVTAIKALWRDGHTEHRGERLELNWDAKPVPVIIAGSGPKSLALAGELGDGAMIEAGVRPENIEWARGHIDAGAKAAGRRVDDLDLWWYLKSSIGETHEEALGYASAQLASAGAHVLGHIPHARGVPEHLQAGCRDLHARYDMATHVSTGGDDPNRRLLEDPVLRDYLLDRFGLVGTKQGWIDRIKELQARGVQRIFCAAVVPNLDDLIRVAGTDVLTAVRAGRTAVRDPTG